VLSNNKNKLNGTYVYRHKHNYIPCSMFTITKVQLHVSAINAGHLQVVLEELINKLYQRVWGVYSLRGGVGASSHIHPPCVPGAGWNLQFNPAPGAHGHQICIKCTKADVRLRTPDDGQKGCPKHVEL